MISKKASERMRPKLKNDTFYIPTRDGIFFQNNQGSFVLENKVIYRWVESLAPYLDGQHTVEELCWGLAPEKQKMVQDLIRFMLSNGLVKDVADELPHGLSQVEQESYAAEIAFIDSFCDSAAHRFERFRESQVLLIGSGLTMTALVHSALRCGLRQPAVSITDECPTNRRRLHEYHDLLRERDPRQCLQEMPSLNWQNPDDVAAAIGPFDVIIHVSDRPMFARAQLLNKLCLTQRKTLIQAAVVDGTAWIGPLVYSESPGCWECAWLRQRSNLSEEQAQLAGDGFQDDPLGNVSRFVAAPTAAVVSNQLSFEILKYLTGAGALETEGGMVMVDLETIQSMRHAFLPHPLCTACRRLAVESSARFVERIHALEVAEPLDQATFSKQAVACFDTQLGVFSSIDERAFVQMPLKIAQVVLSNPLSSALEHPLTVIGIGSDFAAARLRATQGACERYALSVVDRRRLFDRAQALPGWDVRHDEWMCAFPDLDRCKDWIWGYSLLAKEARPVPAPLVYPALRTLLFDHAQTVGLASGMSWAEALCQALSSHCTYMTIERLQRAPEPFPQIDLRAALHDESGKQYHELLELSGEQVVAYDVTSQLRIATYAFCIGAKTITYSTHIDSQLALRNGLEQVLRYVQSVTNRQPDYLPPAVPELPPALRSCEVVVPDYPAPLEWPARQEMLCRAFGQEGWEAIAVPLDHDPALTAILPFVVFVALIQHPRSKNKSAPSSYRS